MTFASQRLSMFAAACAASLTLGLPLAASAGQGAARQAVDAQPGRSVEQSARQRARELNQDSVLRGVGQGGQTRAELARGQASSAEPVRVAQPAGPSPAKPATAGAGAR